jgi:hypothetical protein
VFYDETNPIGVAFWGTVDDQGRGTAEVWHDAAAPAGLEVSFWWWRAQGVRSRYRIR